MYVPLRSGTFLKAAVHPQLQKDEINCGPRSPSRLREEAGGGSTGLLSIAVAVTTSPSPSGQGEMLCILSAGDVLLFLWLRGVPFVFFLPGGALQL